MTIVDAHKGPLMEINPILFYSILYYSDSLKGDSVHKSFEWHSKTVILIFLVLFEHDFLRNLRNLSGKRNGNKHV